MRTVGNDAEVRKIPPRTDPLVPIKVQVCGAYPVARVLDENRLVDADAVPAVPTALPPVLALLRHGATLRRPFGRGDG